MSGVSARSRIMYMENKAESLSGPARIGRVTFSKSRRTIYYGGRAYQRVMGYKYNHVDAETGDEYWISGPRKDGEDRLYGEAKPVDIDDDVREEYWVKIRRLPDRIHSRIANR